MSGLSEQERESLFRAGDHHPDICDCPPNPDEWEYDPQLMEFCQGYENTLTTVERIKADAVAAAREEAAQVAVVALVATGRHTVETARAALAAGQRGGESRG